MQACVCVWECVCTCVIQIQVLLSGRVWYWSPFHNKHWHKNKKQLPENSLRSIFKNEHSNRETSFSSAFTKMWDFTSIQNIWWVYIISSQDSKRFPFSYKLKGNILKYAKITFYLIPSNSPFIIIHYRDTKRTLKIIQCHWESWVTWVTILLSGRCLVQKLVMTMTILMEIFVIFLSTFTIVAVCLTPTSVSRTI